MVQGLLSSQSTGFPPVHTPEEQASCTVHALPSSHVVPFASLGLTQTPPWHVSWVQGLPSVHDNPPVDSQLPATH